ncbi:sugar-transfer associated ATP-grasp domain-containing protein [Parapedobacter deserti]|uniref:Sugar-transfer associated ATP-grasp domain-containing protein n=1 Tax=Parapedobacter deserti TaxID=1912957 RepID=A0ABV7JIR4_9SPHI
MIRQIAKKLVKRYWSYEYHTMLNGTAGKILRNIESIKGKTDPKLIKLSNEYANDVFGWKGYAPWLSVYSAVSGSFKEGWIPDNYYGRIVVPTLKGDYGRVANLKSFNNKIFKRDVFPDLVYYANGLFFSTDYEVIPPEKIKEIVFKKSNRIVFKSDNSAQGRGISFFEKSSFDVNKVKMLGNGVIQDYIRQHAFFNELMPNSVATMRFTTTIDDGGNSVVRACYLRIGRNADTHVKSDSHIMIPINLRTGNLYEHGFTPKWTTTDRHPDTGILFENKSIPNFTKCLSTALELHKLMPQARCIGWDMIVDENNDVKIMEWNGNHNGIKFSEATQGPCFSDLHWETLWKKQRSLID